MDFDEVIKNSFSFATKCCRSIKFINVKTIIDQYVEGTNKIISPIFSFSLESLPYTDCLISLNATSKNIKFIPSNEFLFSNTTQSLTKSFQIQSLVNGIFEVSVQALSCGHTTLNGDSFSLEVVPLNAPPPPPKIVEIRYSDNGNIYFILIILHI